jgi:hypothetical protein
VFAEASAKLVVVPHSPSDPLAFIYDLFPKLETVPTSEWKLDRSSIKVVGDGVFLSLQNTYARVRHQIVDSIGERSETEMDDVSPAEIIRRYDANVYAQSLPTITVDAIDGDEVRGSKDVLNRLACIPSTTKITQETRRKSGFEWDWRDSDPVDKIRVSCNSYAVYFHALIICLIASLVPFFLFVFTKTTFILVRWVARWIADGFR